MADIDRLRYRVEDVVRSVTKMALKALRARELQAEATNS